MKAFVWLFLSRTWRADAGEAITVVRRAREHAQPVAGSWYDRIELRFRSLSGGLHPMVDVMALTDRVCSGLHTEVEDAQVDELMAETAAYSSSMHPDFGRLAARVVIARLHSRVDISLLSVLRVMRDHTADGFAVPLIRPELLAVAETHAPVLEAALVHERDFELDYFGLRTLQRSYLRMTRDGVPIERPQHMLMRVALSVHGADLPAVLQAYDLMSRGVYTHATPTLFNAGALRQQLCSCFLLTAQAGCFDLAFNMRPLYSLIRRAYLHTSGGLCGRYIRIIAPVCSHIEGRWWDWPLSISHSRISVAHTGIWRKAPHIYITLCLRSQLGRHSLAP